MDKKFYVTTPIYYVNDQPHIGHTCTTLAADIIARYHRLLGEKVFFLTGTDEHRAKVAQAAKKAGLLPQDFCDQVSQSFQNIWPQLNIKYHYFVRTTNPDHKKIVQAMLQKIYRRGDIYQAQYQGYYCVGCEKFITETELVNGRCPLHPKQKIQKQSEKNYFFKLSAYVPSLIKAIEDESDPHHYEIIPESKKREVLSKLKVGVADLSVSRAHVAWGIPVPWDEKQTIYVWFDALLNYYSALEINHQKKFWPANVHVVAKDILWFHTVIWEAMLLSAGLSLPKTIFIHSFYTVAGQKMSKSLGNVITPHQLLEKFGIDGTRYLIAANFPYSSDRDVSWQKFDEKFNADLANGLGNLVARIAKLCENSQLKFEPAKPGWDRRYQKYLAKYQLEPALKLVWQWISRADQQVNQNQVWQQKGAALKKSLQSLVADIRQIAYHLQPFVPETAAKIAKQFAGPAIKTQPPLFPRLK